MRYLKSVENQIFSKVALCRLALFCIGVSSLNTLLGQNLIPNSSFELTRPEEFLTKCDLTSWQGQMLSFWKQQNTADHICIESPISRRGDLKIFPADGIRMVGIYMNNPQSSGISEYIYTALNISVQAGCRYRFEAFIRFSDLYSHQTDILDLKLIHEDVCEKDIKRISGQTVSALIDKKLAASNNWLTLRYDFIADDNYQWLAIGSIVERRKFSKASKNASLYGAYIYLDELSLTCLSGCLQNEAESMPQELSKEPQLLSGLDTSVTNVVPEEDKSSVTDELVSGYPVSFDYNSYFILEDNKPLLESVLQQFDFSREYLLIVGHTDQSGTESYNFQLAMKRAEAVRDFYIPKGMQKDQILIISKGKTEPVSTKKDESSQGMNRRVEIFIKNK